MSAAWVHVGSSAELPQMLVTGMSGSGLSGWLLYLMWVLARAGKTVVLQRHRTGFYVFNR